jgi:hypothetical protein
MNNLYYVKISLKGKNSFTSTLSGYNELTIYNGRDVYTKGLSVSDIELLKQIKTIIIRPNFTCKS